MSYCEQCNRIVRKVKMPNGKEISLDPKAAVYRIVAGTEGDENPVIERSTAGMVDHSYTCPAAKFSTPKRAEEKMFP